MKRGWMVLIWICLLAGVAQAQRPFQLQRDQQAYGKAMELFEQNKFAPARKHFEEYLQTYCKINTSVECANAEYFIARCALELYHKDAEYLMEVFIRNHPDSPNKERAYFEMGLFYGKKKSANKCLEWFNKVDLRSLPANDQIVFHYYKAESLLSKGDKKNARGEYFTIKDKDSPYRNSSLYMYSHLAYEDGDYTAALEGFELLKTNPLFQDRVPIYIAQIYYLQRRYDDLIAYSEQILEAAKSLDEAKANEIKKMVGDAYFNQELYPESLPFLTAYAEAKNKVNMTREDRYRLAYALQRSEQWDAAVEWYNAAKNNEELLGQLAAYNEGVCQMKLNNKREAWKAFGAARDMEFDADLQEDAMFNFAKIAFELSSDPFDDAITSFEEYLKKYPDSPRHDEAYQFLLNVYMKTKNYEKALGSLDKIKKKDNVIKAAYQNLSFNRAVELYQSREFDRALTFFQQVYTYPLDERVNASARFWMAEIAYQKKDFDFAFKLYQAFLDEPGAYETEYYGAGYYGQGYCKFKKANDVQDLDEAKKDYLNALPYFKKYLEGNWERDQRKNYDAILRVADVYFVNKMYEEAIVYYDKVADDSQGNKDYAMYQKALAYGYLSQPEKKSWVLKSMLKELPGSKYEVDAIYELAKSYLMEDRLQESVDYYNLLLTEHKGNAYTKKALVDQCLLYAKQGKFDAMKTAWNNLVQQFPNDAVLLDAIAIVKPVLIEDVAFQNQIKGIKVLNVSSEDIEEEVYARAAELGFSENCEAAVPKLQQYIQQFQPALHTTEAHYLLAECLFKSNDLDKALDAYNVVIAQPFGEYTEDALLTASTINFNRKNWDIAAQHYTELEQIAASKNNVLEAQVGLMRCFYYKKDFVHALEYANKVIDNQSIPDDIKNTAHMWRGLMHAEQKNYSAARTDWDVVIAKGGKQGAEAKYQRCLSFYNEANFTQTETEIYEMVDQFAGFEEAKNKSFLLLVDAYTGMGDFFQAKATVDAIMSNVEDEKVKQEANAKLAVIMEKENAELEKLKEKPTEEIINMNENGEPVAPVQPENQGGENE